MPVRAWPSSCCAWRLAELDAEMARLTALREQMVAMLATLPGTD